MIEPTITVIMPVYQGARYLAAAIESVLSQTYKDFKLVMVDDGSTDNSEAIARSYLGKDQRVFFLQKEHSGVSNTLNHACNHSKSKYIALLDQDDIAMPSRLEKQVAVLEQHPEYAVLGSCAISIDEAGTPFRLLKRPTIEQGLSYSSMLESNLIINCSAMMRRSVFDSVGGYRVLKHAGAEDYDLWLRISKSHLIQNLPSILAGLRTHLEQGSFAGLPAQILSAIEARENALTFSSGGPLIQKDDAVPKATRPTEIQESVIRGYLEYATLYAKLGRQATAASVLSTVQTYTLEEGCADLLIRILDEDAFADLPST